MASIAAAADSPANNINIEHSLEEALAQFRQKSHERCYRPLRNVIDSFDPLKNSRTLDSHRVCFKNRAMVEQLTEFLCKGKNRDGHAVQKLSLDPCTFDTESALPVLCNYFESNKSPKALENVELSNDENRYDAAAVYTYEILLSAFHNNSTVKSLALFSPSVLRGTTGGAMVGDLLLKNKTLTLLHLGRCPAHNDFLPAMREGLLASSGRLQRLGLQYSHIGNEALQQLRSVYESNGHHQNNVLRELDLSCNENDIQGPASGNHLRRLLLTLPHLRNLKLSFNYLGPDGATALFAVDPTAVMSRLHRLDLGYCNIGNLGLAQMVASMPESAPLVFINLSENDIQGHAGGESLARLLHCCEQLETLCLCGNENLGPEGARALAPALADHCSMQHLDVSYCLLGDSGASEILKSLIPSITTTTTTRPACLKSLQLETMSLSPATLVSLSDYLKGPGRSLEHLDIFGNEVLFETANDDQRQSFFEALAKHKILHTLHLTFSGMPYELLLSSLLQNTSLLHVRYYPNKLASIMAEYSRRNKLLSKMKTTMDKKPVDVSLPLALWPLALDVASPARCDDNQIIVGPTVAFCLIQKMMVSNVYSHTARVYRFEKVRACKRVQRWWRERRLQ